MTLSIAVLTGGIGLPGAQAAPQCGGPAGSVVHLPPLEQEDEATVSRTTHSVVAAGVNHSVAVTSDGSAWAWGENTYNMLGDSDFDDWIGTVPHRVPSVRTAVAVTAGGDRSAALLSNGTVVEWGPARDPRAVCPLTQVVEVSQGGLHGLALRSNGSVWVWGTDRFGQRGDGEATSGAVLSPAATPVAGIADATAVAAGSSHSLALLRDGTVWAWGKNDYGQLGGGYPTSDGCRCVALPTKVVGLSDVVAIGAGDSHSLAVTADGQVWGWGSNGFGQLGQDGMPYPTPVLSPTPIAGLPPAKAVDGGDHTIVLAQDGTVWGFGENGDFQTGKDQWEGGLNHPDPVQVQSLDDVTGIAVGAGYADAGDPIGGFHTLAVRSDGSIWGWGDRWFGQLGNGDPRIGGTWIPRQASNISGAPFSHEYVAFGDSITTGYSNATCSGDFDARAKHADGCGEPGAGPATPYPSHVAAALEVSATRVGIWGYTAEEATNAFAAGTNRYEAENFATEGDWEPQLAAVTRATRLVTGALGINDMQFSDVKTWATNCVSPTLGVDESRCRTYAAEKAQEVRSYISAVVDAMAVARLNGAQAVATLYYNPFADLPECELSHGIAEVILDELNDVIAELATARNLTIADLRTPFYGHGAGLPHQADTWVVGTKCDDLLAAWQGVMPDFLGGDKDAVAQQFDPHPNDAGTLAIAQAILEVVSPQS